jgi:hypothetical protein
VSIETNVDRARQPLQIGLHTFLLIMAGVGVSLRLGGINPGFLPLGIVVTAAMTAALAPSTPRRWTQFLVIMTILIVAEGVAAHLAYFTAGDVESFIIHISIYFNVLFLGMFAAFPRGAYTLMLLLAAAILPGQVSLGSEWRRLDDEANSAIIYLDRYQSQTAGYPRDLSGYPFKHPNLARKITYAMDPNQGYVVSYRTGSSNIRHKYSPNQGWHYYPDS